MLKWIEPKELTEGDWVAKDVFVAGKNLVPYPAAVITAFVTFISFS